MQKDIQEVFVLIKRKYGSAIFEDTSKLGCILEDVAPWLCTEIQSLNKISIKQIGLRLQADTNVTKMKLQKQLIDEILQEDECRCSVIQKCICIISDLVNDQSIGKTGNGMRVPNSSGQRNKSFSALNNVDKQNQIKRNQTPCWKIENNGKVIRVSSLGSGSKFWIDYEIKSVIEKVIIEEGITETTLEAFAGMKKLKEIVFPTTLLKVGYSSFENCYSLTKIIIPKGVKIIAGKAFRNCTSLREVIIPDTVRYIGNDAFLGYNGNEIRVNGDCLICPGNYCIKASTSSAK